MSRVRDKADFQFAGEDYTHGAGVRYVANAITTTDLDASGTISNIHLQDIADVASVTASNDGYFLKYDHATTSFAWSQVSGGGGGTMNDLVDDTTPQLGGNLLSNSYNIKMADSDEVVFGSNDDANIKHTGTNFNVNVNSGDINIRTYDDDKDVIISTDDGSGSIANYFKADGSTGEAILYHYGTEKFKTISTGAQITGNLTVSGDFTVNGTTTTINTTELTVSDNIITLNNDETGTPSQNAGIAVERGTSSNVDIRWNETTDKWEFTNDGATYSDIGSGGDVVDDTTPQLGGDLDVNGNSIEYTFSLSGSSSPNYVFSDAGNNFFTTNTNNPTLYLTRGVKYAFTNIAGSHPFRIQSQNSVGGALYNTGVTNNNGTGTVTFTPPMDAPDELYYYCNVHSAMKGIIKIIGAGGASTGDISFSASTMSSTGNTITINDNLSVTGSISSSQAGAPILSSASSITLEADSSSRVHVSQSPFRLYNVSTTNRNAITAADGDLVYDSDLDGVFAFQNGSWINIGGGGSGSSATTDILTITTTSANPSAPSSGSVHIYEDNSTLTFMNSRAGTGHYQMKMENSAGTFLMGVDGLGNIVTSTSGTMRAQYFYAVSNTSYYVAPALTGTAMQLAGDMKTDGSYIGSIKERSNADTTTSGTLDFDAKDYEIYRLTQSQGANRVLNIRGDGSTSLDSIMSTGEFRTVAIAFKNGSTPYYFNTFRIDGNAITVLWSGGSAPSAGNASSTDFYTLSICKTSSATFEVYGSFTRYA
tara:strand:+ start:474 stop:2762 length:2289 start_codon:yes stop_codon:yes gene_type:complete